MHSVALRKWLSELCQQIYLAHHSLFPSGASRKNVGFAVGKPLPPHPTRQKTWLSFETKEEHKPGLLLKDSLVRPLSSTLSHTDTSVLGLFSSSDVRKAVLSATCHGRRRMLCLGSWAGAGLSI